MVLYSRLAKNTSLTFGGPELSGPDCPWDDLTNRIAVARWEGVSQSLHHGITNAEAILRTGGESLHINRERAPGEFEAQ